MVSSRRVSYFYDAEVGNYHYGQGTQGMGDYHWHPVGLLCLVVLCWSIPHIAPLLDLLQVTP